MAEIEEAPREWSMHAQWYDELIHGTDQPMGWMHIQRHPQQTAMFSSKPVESVRVVEDPSGAYRGWIPAPSEIDPDRNGEWPERVLATAAFEDLVLPEGEVVPLSIVAESKAVRVERQVREATERREAATELPEHAELLALPGVGQVDLFELGGRMFVEAFGPPPTTILRGSASSEVGYAEALAEVLTAVHGDGTT